MSTLLVDVTWDFAEVLTTHFLSCVGFGDRLLSEVKKLAPKDVKIRVGAISFVFVTYQVCCSVTLKEPCSDCSCHLLQTRNGFPETLTRPTAFATVMKISFVSSLRRWLL